MKGKSGSKDSSGTYSLKSSRGSGTSRGSYKGNSGGNYTFTGGNGSGIGGRYSVNPISNGSINFGTPSQKFGIKEIMINYAFDRQKNRMNDMTSYLEGKNTSDIEKINNEIPFVRIQDLYNSYQKTVPDMFRLDPYDQVRMQARNIELSRKALNGKEPESSTDKLKVQRHDQKDSNKSSLTLKPINFRQPDEYRLAA